MNRAHSAGAFCLAALTTLTAATALAESRNPARIVRELLADPPPGGEPLSFEEISSRVDVLVERKAAGAIDAALGKRKIEYYKLAPLIEALGRMNTPEAVATLRKLLFTSRFLSADVEDWIRLARTLERGSAKSGPPVLRFLWSRFPVAVRESLTGTSRKGRGPSPRMKERVLRGLNAALDEKGLPERLEPSGLELEDEGRALLARYRALAGSKPGGVLAPIEIERLNRRVLNAALEGALRPFDTLRLDLYEPRTARIAMNELDGVELPEARELMLTVRPAGIFDQITQIKAAKKLEGTDASALIADYLLKDDVSLSTNARDALVERFAQDPFGGRAIMADVIARLERVAKGEVPRVVAANVVEVLAAVLDAGTARDLFEKCLSSRAATLRDAALRKLVELPDVARSERVVDALFEISEETESGEVAKAVLSLVKAARIEEALEIAAAYLEHEDLEVRALAVSVLRTVSRENLGRNPEVWRKAVSSDPDFIVKLQDQLDQPTAPVRVTAESEDAVEERRLEVRSQVLTRTVYIAIAMAGAGAAVFFLLVRPALRRHSAGRIDKGRRRRRRL